MSYPGFFMDLDPYPLRRQSRAEHPDAGDHPTPAVPGTELKVTTSVGKSCLGSFLDFGVRAITSIAIQKG
jgi:hypothetical protein